MAYQLTQTGAEVQESLNTVPENEERIDALETDVSSLQSGKADKATTLAGYDIGDAYTKEQVDNMITTPDQKYVSVTATDQTTDVTEVLPAEGAANTIYRVGNWDGTQYDDSAYSEYAWDGTQYIPLSKKQPGIDDEPTAGSNNLVKSGGVFSSYNPDIIITAHTYLGKTGSVLPTDNAFSTSDFYYVVAGIRLIKSRGHSAVSSDYTFVCFYDTNKNFISGLRRDTLTEVDYTIIASDIPDGAIYFRACLGDSGRIEMPVRNVMGKISEEVNDLKDTVAFEDGCNVINKYGHVVTTSVASFYVTKPVQAKAGVVLHNCHAASGSEMTFAAVYDIHGDCVNVIKKSDSDTSAFDYTLTADDIPETGVYVRATMYSNGYISNYKYYANWDVLKDITDKISSMVSVSVGMIKKYYLTSTGGVKAATLTTFNVTDFCPVVNGIKVINCHRASAAAAANTFLCFYDEDYGFLSNVTSEAATVSEYVLSSENIPSGAAYFRATVYEDGYVDYLVPVSRLVSTKSSKGGSDTLSYFDYDKALAMDKNTLVEMVESSSNGRCTALFDDDGYPSLMYKIPKVSIGALAPSLGTLEDTHPAFIVDGVEKDYIYVAVFLTSQYNGHYVSWYGLQPKGRVNLSDLRSGISGKGEGWHLETVYERSLIALLAMKLNSPTPTGNTNNGMSHVNPWEYCQHANGSLPGEVLPNRTGIEWINGTQPAAWSHNKELWGIQDVIGGYHEICDLFKIVDGKIYYAEDNNYFNIEDDAETFEDDWTDTGVYYDFLDNTTMLSDSRTVVQTDYAQRDYTTIGCTSGYDNIALETRKRLALLMLSPKLESSDEDTVFPIAGRFGVNNGKPTAYTVVGGAEEYTNSGLASHIISVNLKEEDAHYNMGSRIVYIP